MKELTQKLKALGDPNRFRITMMLRQRPLCVCEILSILDISGGTLSSHLMVLKNAGLIDQRKDGRWIEYFIVDDALKFIEEIGRFNSDEAVINSDAKKVAESDRNLCSKQLRG